MISIAVVALLCSSAAAEPARTTVEKLVRTAVATVGASLLADGAVIDVYGIDESADLVAVGALSSHGAGGKITRKIEPRGVTVIADDAAGIAWFVAPYALDIVDMPMDVLEVHTRERVAGLALRIGTPGGSPVALRAHDAGQGADGSGQPVDRGRCDPHRRRDCRRCRRRPRSPRLVRHLAREGRGAGRRVARLGHPVVGAGDNHRRTSARAGERSNSCIPRWACASRQRRSRSRVSKTSSRAVEITSGCHLGGVARRTPIAVVVGESPPGDPVHLAPAPRLRREGAPERCVRVRISDMLVVCAEIHEIVAIEGERLEPELADVDPCTFYGARGVRIAAVLPPLLDPQGDHLSRGEREDIA